MNLTFDDAKIQMDGGVWLCLKVKEPATARSFVMEKNAALLESGGKHQQFWQDIPEQIMMVYGVDAHCPEDIGRRIQLLKTAENE